MARASQAVLRVAWVLAATICVFTIENLCIDRWAQKRSHAKLPSFLAEAPSAAWFLILLALTISVAFLAIGQVLIMRDRSVSKPKKALTAVLVFAAAVLSGEWFIATSGMRLAEAAGRGAAATSRPPQKRSVVLRWQASTTPNVKYNVYRGPFAGIHPDKLNGAPLDGTTFTDTTAASGQTYWYVVRAVDAKGEESLESNDTPVTIP